MWVPKKLVQAQADRWQIWILKTNKQHTQNNYITPTPQGQASLGPKGNLKASQRTSNPTKADKDKADMGTKTDIQSANKSKIYLGIYYEPSERATKKQTRRAAQDNMDLATQTKDNRARKDRCISYITIEEKIEAMHLRRRDYAISSGLYPLPNQSISSRRTQNRKGEAYRRY